MSIKALIIDDLPLAIASLQADLSDNHTDVKVVGTADGVLSAAKQIKKLKPNLLFLDIHMGDGDGFDLLEMIGSDDLKVIFTTASEDHALRAFRFDAVDYLLKPIQPDLLAQALDKVRASIGVQKKTDVKDPDGSIALNTQEEIRIVKISDLIRLEAMGNYTTFHTVDGKILVTKTLKEFEAVLPDSFIRVHQSHLVNSAKIKAYIKTEGGYLKMIDGSDVSVSVRKKSQVMDLLR